MTERESLALLERLTIPEGTVFTSDQVRNLLDGPSPPSAVIKKAVSASKTKPGKKLMKNTPMHMPTRKVHLPKTTLRRPGGILPMNTARLAAKRGRFSKDVLSSDSDSDDLSQDEQDCMNSLQLSIGHIGYGQQKSFVKTLQMNPASIEREISHEELTSDDDIDLEVFPLSPQTQDVSREIFHEELDSDDGIDLEVYPINPSDHEISREIFHEEVSSDEDIDMTPVLQNPHVVTDYANNPPVVSRTNSDNDKPDADRRSVYDAQVDDFNFDADNWLLGDDDTNDASHLSRQDSIQSTSSRNSGNNANGAHDGRRHPPRLHDMRLSSSSDEDDDSINGAHPNAGHPPRSADQMNISDDDDPDDNPDDPSGSQDNLPVYGPHLPRDRQFADYADIEAQSQVICDGPIKVADFRKAQRLDTFCQDLETLENRPRRFVKKRDIWFYRFRNAYKPVLPEALLDGVINMKHYSAYGLHASKTRVAREINNLFYILPHVLKQHLKDLLDNCFICQIHGNRQPQHHIQSTDFARAPRQTWSLDLMPSMPRTKSGFTRVLLAADYYTGFIQCIPLQNKEAPTLIKAIEDHLIRPFGKPKFFRSDEESGIYNSDKFYDFCKRYGIQLLATAQSSPSSNGLAEVSIRNIKTALRKFIQQEHIDEWDLLLTDVINAHNSSISVYGHSPEEALFGYRIPNPTDLLQFWPNVPSPQAYLDTIEPKVKSIRDETRRRINKAADKQRTFRNKSTVSKKFQLGELVLHRQLQVATSVGNSLTPRFTGPYVIVQLNNDNSTAIVEHTKTNHQVKAHFSNLQKLQFNPHQIRVPSSLGPNLFPSLRMVNEPDHLFETMEIVDEPPLRRSTPGPITSNTVFDEDDSQPSQTPVQSQPSIDIVASQPPDRPTDDQDSDEVLFNVLFGPQAENHVPLMSNTRSGLFRNEVDANRRDASGSANSKPSPSLAKKDPKGKVTKNIPLKSSQKSPAKKTSQSPPTLTKSVSFCDEVATSDGDGNIFTSDSSVDDSGLPDTFTTPSRFSSNRRGMKRKAAAKRKASRLRSPPPTTSPQRLARKLNDDSNTEARQTLRSDTSHESDRSDSTSTSQRARTTRSGRKSRKPNRFRAFYSK